MKDIQSKHIKPAKLQITYIPLSNIGCTECY